MEATFDRTIYGYRREQKETSRDSDREREREREREGERARERGVIYWQLSNCGTGTYGDRVARGSQRRVRERKEGGERERGLGESESEEKRERTRRKSSLSLFLSLYLDCLAGFPRPRIDTTRPSPRRSFLSLDLFSTLAALVQRSLAASIFPLGQALTFVSFLRRPRPRRRRRRRSSFPSSFLHHYTATEEQEYGSRWLCAVVLPDGRYTRSMRAVEATRDRESKRCTLAAGGGNAAK